MMGYCTTTDLTNVRNEEHRLLLKVLIVSSFVPEIDHPILTTYGPQGAAKSFLLTLIKMLVNPSKPVLLTLLKNIPEFIQQVNCSPQLSKHCGGVVSDISGPWIVVRPHPFNPAIYANSTNFVQNVTKQS